ncbi:MAG: hypothetical protein V1668_00455 [Patescibacteria group bacterium]
MAFTPPPPQTSQPISSQPVRMYTMPAKFHVDDRGSSGGGSRLLLWLIVGLVAAILGVAGYLAYKKFGPAANTNGNQNTAVANQNENSNAAGNQNKNSSTNSNSSGNGNSNINIAANVNKNINSNISGNTNLFPVINVNNANTAVNANVAPVVSSQDSDSDGLTDVEETLFSTNPAKADTDGDGYSDGLEAGGGYNPNGTGKIEANPSIKTYYDNTYGYSILYPGAWALSDDPQNTRGKMFTASGEFVEASVQENPAGLSARDWYLTQSPGIDSSKITSVTNWDRTLSGVLSIDGLTAYFVSGSRVYLINYNINILSQANYKTVFQMMFRSFKIGVVPINTNTSTNLNANRNSNTNTNMNTNLNTNANTNTNTNINSSNTNSNLNSATNRL